MFKLVGKLLNALISNSNSLTFGRLYYKVLSASTSVIVLCFKKCIILLSVLVNSSIFINKLFRKVIQVVSNTISSLVTASIYFHDLFNKTYIYAQDRVRSLEIKKFRDIIIDKIRTVFITKDDIV